MKKRFAPMALLFGLLTASALLLGGTSMAQANPTQSSFVCGNFAVNVVSCNSVLNGSPVTVKITGNRVLTTGEISVLENNLNNTQVNYNDIKVSVVNLYNNTFNIPITVSDVNVCIASICH